MLILTIFTLGAGITSIRGSVGGATYRQPLGSTVGTTSRKKKAHKKGSRIPVIHAAALAWRHLTKAQRDAWRLAAHNNTLLFGTYYSGYQAFTAAWAIGNFLSCSVASPPVSSGHAIADYLITSGSASWSANSYTINWTDGILSTQNVTIIMYWYYYVGQTWLFLTSYTNDVISFLPSGTTSSSDVILFWDTLGIGQPGDQLRFDCYGFDSGSAHSDLYNWKIYPPFYLTIDP